MLLQKAEQVILRRNKNKEWLITRAISRNALMCPQRLLIGFLRWVNYVAYL
ncbi:hypothetical protein SBDP2_680007 [Syntrophobacter sp. SbD2]|nr:hypothetical protein SBDP2_680007 [Syntrophobacter sp. SbD2]